MSHLPSQIKHVVVLMLENRSFDHFCGALPGVSGPAGKSNVDPRDGSVVPVSFDATPLSPALPDPNIPARMVGDPLHDFASVNRQVFETATPLPGTPAPLGGFIRAGRAGGNADANFVAQEVMRCFDTPRSLPTLTHLARTFRLCDHWFSSVPGPTWPNRLFVHAATSFGHMDNKLRFYCGATIYHLLRRAHVDWALYYHDVPHAACFPMPAVQFDSLSRPCMRHVSAFFEEVQEHRPGHGRLPSYVFIEPGYFDAGRGVAGTSVEALKWLGRLLRFPVRASLERANDQHAPHDVRLGEHLIADVYEALRANPEVWNHCLFVVLYDEHGGLFDHVNPPAVPPRAKPSVKPPFAFDRLGLRVPALLVSPWIRSGLESTVYEHSTIVRTVREHFCPGAAPMNDADRNAPTLSADMWAPELRTDAPVRLARPVAEFLVPVRHDPTRPGLSDLQDGLVKLAQATAVESPLARTVETMAARAEPSDEVVDVSEIETPVQTEAEGYAFVRQAMQARHRVRA
jgi:phospholipase C